MQQVNDARFALHSLPASANAPDSFDRAHNQRNMGPEPSVMNHEKVQERRNHQEMKMRTSIILMTSLLALASPAIAQTASAQSRGDYQPSVSISAAPPMVDTGSEAYPSSSTGADEPRVTVTAAPPIVDTGSQAYPSSATGAGEHENQVIAGGPMVTLSNGQSMPESINSFPPGFTDPYLAHR